MNSETMSSAMQGKTKLGLLPQLRFPQFRGEEGWEMRILSDLSEVVCGSSPHSMSNFITTEANGLHWLKVSDIHTDTKYITRTAEKIHPQAVAKTRLVNPGDLVLSSIANIGQPYILQSKVCISDNWIAITNITKKTDSAFLYYSISAPGSQNHLTGSVVGTTLLRLNVVGIKALPVSLPSISEQQKIVACLSSLDEFIAAQARKIEVLKIHQQAMMQQLFPRAGESLPRFRFPEFKTAGNWTKMCLGQAATFHSGHPYKQEELRDSGAYPVLRAADVLSGKTKYSSDLELDEKKYCTNGDLLFASAASIGPHIWHGKKAIYGNDLWKVIAQQGVDKTFLFTVLINEMVKIKSKNTNSLGVTRFTKETIETWEATFPGIDEQKKIAQYLTILGDVISAEIEKFNALKTHKKGLMQKIFPSFNTTQS